MHINQLKESKFLKKEDVGKGILVTIAGLIQENVALKEDPEELKYCLTFVEEGVLPMVLNQTNAKLIAGIVGNEDTDGWVGHQIVLYNDPTIAFAGRIMGGIRARAPKKIAPAVRPAPATAQTRPAPSARLAAPAPAPLPVEEVEEDDVPF